jgi:predicted anti-sigma-YlaC factor YlaD
MEHGCDDVRVSLSAHTDGEDGPLSIQQVDDHVHGCEQCTLFAAELSLLDERVATFLRVPVEDRTAAILTAAAEERPTTGPSIAQLRGLLGLAAAVQVIIGVLALVGGGDHVARDLAFFELAAGGGLGAAAWRPRLAAGLLPVVGVAAAFGLVALVGEVAMGSVSLATELGHLVLLVATWPLATLARWEGAGGTVAQR